MRGVFRVAGYNYARMINLLVSDEEVWEKMGCGRVRDRYVYIYLFTIVADASLSRQGLANLDQGKTPEELDSMA